VLEKGFPQNKQFYSNLNMPQLIKFIEINILSDSLEYLNFDFLDKSRLTP